MDKEMMMVAKMTFTTPITKRQVEKYYVIDTWEEVDENNMSLQFIGEITEISESEIGKFLSICGMSEAPSVTIEKYSKDFKERK